jgi:transposase InsO family protein
MGTPDMQLPGRGLDDDAAYVARYPSSDNRRQAVTAWIHYYNNQRPHVALGHETPASRLHDD